MQSSSVAKPAVSESSAEIPAMDGVFVWYNIGWMRSRFNKLQKHEATLKADLLEAVEQKVADVILLCECGEVGAGLGEEWLNVVRRCCGPGFDVTHQSHYASIVRRATVEVLEGPSLKGPVCQE